jgi:aldehyde dehydrogenase (NAD+)
MALINDLEKIKAFYDSGATRSYEFRKAQLQKFRSVLLKYENEIYEALYADLKKSKEEAYASELGMLLGEIRLTLKNLQQWMKPRTVSTGLVNQPSVSKIYRDPFGVALIIGPWNYPLQLLMIPLAGAIAGGNCAVLKPSEFSTATTAIISKIIKEIFPPEYVLVVEGEGSVVIPEMMNGFQFDYVFYTGSVPVGKIIYKMAAEKLIPVTLELGGKSPGIVEADANLKVAAKRLVLGKFLNAGQTCIAPDYILAHASVKEELVREMIIAIENFYSKNSQTDYNYGKIINHKRFDAITRYLQDGRVIYGGRHNRDTCWIEPTLLDEVKPDAPVMKEEIFGPVLPVLTFNTTEEAMAIVKRNENPLALYLFTGSSKKEQEWVTQTPFGNGCINEAAWQFANKNFPFGGVGNSGLGAYHGHYTFNTFTREKPVLNAPTWLDLALKYPPLNGRLKLFKRIIR